MAAGPLSYSQALRVIGQNLISLGPEQFELVKSGDGYLVRLPKAEVTVLLPAKSSFLGKLVNKIRGSAEPEAKTSHSISFNEMAILRSDIEQQAKRRTDSPRDARDLSFALRVVGNYLDRRLAREFTIWVSVDGVKVQYDQKQDMFTRQQLYDLGIQMYLKRSSRR